MLHLNIFMKQLLFLIIFINVLLINTKAQFSDCLIGDVSNNAVMNNISTNQLFTISVEDTSKVENTGDKVQNFIEKAFKYSPLPFGGYATETSWVLGITKYNAFRVKSDILPDSMIQPSSILAYFYYTGEQQYKVYLNADIMHHSNKFNSQFEFMFLDYPSLYFGLGNENVLDSGYLVDYKNLMIAPTFYYNAYEKMYIGAKYTFNNFIDVKNVDPRNPIADSAIKSNEGIQSGIGLHMYRESRDNRIRAKKGSYLNVGYDYYTKVLGSNFNYGTLSVDYRKYYTPIPQLTIAGQFFGTLTHGDIPVQSMPVVGGPYRMRGVYENRFRDNQMVMTQLELRFPIYWIIYGSTFADMGQVANTVNDFRFDEFHYGYGAGLRILIDKETSSVLRFDISFSEGKHEIFVGFNEAF